MNKQAFTIQGMHCQGCANTVKNVLQQSNANNQVEVNFETATATVESSQIVKLVEINKALAAYGDFKLLPKN